MRIERMMKRGRWFALGALLVAVPAVRGANPAEEWLTPERWQKIEKNPEAIGMFVAGTQTLLGRLGYGVTFNGTLDEAMQAALRAYQLDRALPATGWLDLQTLMQARRDEKALDRQVALLPFPTFFGDLWSQYVSAGGTWVMENDTQGNALQATEISCYRETMQCVEATAVLGEGSLAPTLNVLVENYGIERWDEHEIVTRPNDKVCVRYVLRINRHLGAVTAIRSTINREGLCQQADTKDIHLRLADGGTISRELMSTREETRRNLTKLDPRIFDRSMKALNVLFPELAGKE